MLSAGSSWDEALEDPLGGRPALDARRRLDAVGRVEQPVAVAGARLDVFGVLLVLALAEHVGDAGPGRGAGIAAFDGPDAEVERPHDPLQAVVSADAAEAAIDRSGDQLEGGLHEGSGSAYCDGPKFNSSN